MEEGIIIGGEFRKCDANKDILIETADWLIDIGMLNESDEPILKRETRYVLNKEKTHSNGKEFESEHKLERINMFLETNWDPETIIQISKNLLDEFGLPEDILKIVKVEEVERF